MATEEKTAARLEAMMETLLGRFSEQERRFEAQSKQVQEVLADVNQLKEVAGGDSGFEFVVGGEDEDKKRREEEERSHPD